MSEEKKKKTSQRMNQWQFLLWWILAHGLGATLLTAVYYFFSQPISWLNPPEWLNFPILLLIMGALPGFLFSIPQKWLMKRGFGLDVNGWRRASIVAYLIGYAAMYIGIRSFSMDFIGIFPLALIALRYLPLILVQSLLLNRHIKRAWLWGLASIVSLIIFPQLAMASTIGFTLSQTILLAPVQATLTGLTLLWIYGMAQADKSQAEQAIDNAALERLGDKLSDEEYLLEDGTQSALTASS